MFDDEQLCHFTLEEFLEKFPYKVGDKVTLDKYPCVIIGMNWDCDDIIYYVKGMDFSKGVYSTDKDLQPYKEETMEEKLEQITFDIPDGYEFFGINDDNQVVLAKKQPQYPKTYEECCGALKIPNDERYIDIDVPLNYNKLLTIFTKLLICRDAYWKIAGDWKPDWTKADERKYCIVNTEGNITKWVQKTTNKILAFPTEEMRDIFYENFKELIEQCKELL